jgi:hypothetical protein
MARKKNRPARSRSPQQTAVVPQAAVTGTTTTTPVKVFSPAAVSHPDGLPKLERSWIELAAIRIARSLGSLQMAVVLLTLFAAVLAIGTMVESWYSDKLAKELVYKTWWFTTLLALLGVTIFFAAVKKWPWKKYQTGFLITHLGLLTLLAGGIVNSVQGTDAVLPLIDSDDPAFQREYELPQASGQIIDRDDSHIVITRFVGGEHKTARFRFNPGTLPWSTKDYEKTEPDMFLQVLNWFAHPFGRSWSVSVDNGAKLEVLGYYPHVTRKRTFRDALPEEARSSFPAVHVHFVSQMTGMKFDGWVASNPHSVSQSVFRPGPGQLELLGSRLPADLVDEFCSDPRSHGVRGRKGQLVLVVKGEKHRVNVEESLANDRWDPIGESGWSVKVSHYSGQNQEIDYPSYPAFRPVVRFDLKHDSQPNEVMRFQTEGRYSVGRALPMVKERFSMQAARRLYGEDFNRRNLQVWYHAPDNRWGDDALRAVVQLIPGEDGQLYYRSFHSSGVGGFRYESSGTIRSGGSSKPVWGGMQGRIRVSNYLSEAIPHWNYTLYEDPELRPGIEPQPGPGQDIRKAIRCRLTRGKDHKDFWVGQTSSGSDKVVVDGEVYGFGYNTIIQDLGFEIKLLRAEQKVDPGTHSAATYTSYVQLTDKSQGIEAEDGVITMNEPLQHRGYKLFQSNYSFVRSDAETNYKPIDISTFAVSWDPGLWLKYLGSIMLALGIVTMFYMKAYFFKPRGRNKASPLNPVTGDA